MDLPISRSDFFVTLTIRVRSAFVSRMKVILNDLTAESRKDPGCILYIAAESAETPGLFLMASVWRDKQSYEAHRSSPYVRAFESQIGPEVVRGSLVQKSWQRLG